jgi:hypothetical protein
LISLKSLSGLSRVDTVRPCVDGCPFTKPLDKPILAFVSLMREKIKTAMLPLVILACSEITVSLQVV